jgi:hypothetical protein
MEKSKREITCKTALIIKKIKFKNFGCGGFNLDSLRYTKKVKSNTK